MKPTAVLALCGAIFCVCPPQRNLHADEPPRGIEVAVADDQAPDPAPHPWTAYLARRKATESILKDTEMSVNLTDAPLSEFLDIARDATELELFIDPTVDQESRSVTFRVARLSVGETLSLVLKMAGLDWCISEQGHVCISSRATIDRFRPAFDADIALLEKVRGALTAEATPGPEPAAQDAVTKEKLEAARVTLEITDGDPFDLLDQFVKCAGINIVVSAEARKSGALPKTVSLSLEGVRGPEAMDRLLEACGLEVVYERGLAFLISPAEGERRRAAAAALAEADRVRREAEAEVLARRVSIPCRGLLLKDLAARLQAELKVPVVLDPETWQARAQVTIDDGPHTVDEILDAVRARIPMRVTLREGTLWLLENR